ncbi:hypothetical protein FEMY_25000 [Ferrovum myxofaciens]|uniref:Uncharacterized protein n=1 Tax=Ferrovum myxofaciens TaxID=416213 RepID=A0A149VUT2_9PROT|nr:hypothetical protein [Ferrovum myxofaciens]KXW56983.1 hypothetical protein FEMY_25000 [Ferrovum myxofaciens]
MKNVTVTKNDKELIEQARAKKEENPRYFPTIEELQAVDRAITEQHSQHPKLKQ